jgi:hypothetical protein
MDAMYRNRNKVRFLDFNQIHYLIAFIILIFISEGIFPQTTLSGYYTENMLLSDTVRVIGDVHVSNDCKFTLKPGTTVIFDGHFKLDILGSIQAVGTEDSLIKFTVADTTGFSNFSNISGGWKGIRFPEPNQTNDSSKLIYCVIEYGKAFGDTVLYHQEFFNSNGGAIAINGFSKLRIAYCHIRNNFAQVFGGGAYIYNASPLIICNKIYNNFAPNSFSISTYYENSHYGGGGGIHVEGVYYFGNSDPIIIGNEIFENVGSYGGGIRIKYSWDGVLINNLIRNNVSQRGGGIYAGASSLKIINNVIYGNFASESGGGMECDGDYIKGLSGYYFYKLLPDVYNCIFLGNTIIDIEPNQIKTQIFTDSSNQYQLNIYNSNIEFCLQGIEPPIDTNSYLGHIKNLYCYNPEFISIASNDFRLKTESPCINRGMNLNIFDSIGYNLDYYGNPRISEDTIDIGISELYRLNVGGHITEDQIWDADIVQVNSYLWIDEDATLTINKGVDVLVAGNCIINVDGMMQVNGTKEEHVTFTVKKYTAPYWLGIYISDGIERTDTSTFNYMDISRVGLIEYPSHIAAISINNEDKVIIRNCFFNDCYFNRSGAIFLSDSDILIDQCVFKSISLIPDMSEGGSVYCYNSSNPLILNSVFVRGIIHWDHVCVGCRANSDPIIVNSILLGTDSPIWLYTDDSDPIIFNSIIEDGLYGIIGNYTGYYENIFTPGSAIFKNEYENDFHLEDSSDCINSGFNGFTNFGSLTDYYGNPRVFNKIVDIGVHESDYNNPPKLLKDFDDYRLPPNFSPIFLNLNDYFSDELPLELINFSAETQNIEILNCSFNVYNNLIIEPIIDQIGQETLVISASDSYEIAQDTFQISVNHTTILSQKPLNVPMGDSIKIFLDDLIVDYVELYYPNSYKIVFLDGFDSVFYKRENNLVKPVKNFFGDITLPIYITDEKTNSTIYDLIITVDKYSDVLEYEDSVFELYPNPAKDFLNIKFQQPEIFSDAVITIYDNNGKEILNKEPFNTSSDNYLLNLNGLKKGLYYLEIFSKKTGKSEVKSFIKF